MWAAKEEFYCTGKCVSNCAYDNKHFDFDFDFGRFLDIEKGYDSMWRKGLLTRLHDAGVNGRIFNWIKDFLKHRSIQVRVGRDMSETVEIKNGAPQGSVISPVLFNVMINDIFQKMHHSFGKSSFADDGAIGRRGEILHICSCKLKGPWIRWFSGSVGR